MQGGEIRDPEPAKERQQQPVDVEVDDLEVGVGLRDSLDHGDVRGKRIWTGRIEPQRASRAHLESGAGDRVAAGEQGRLVPEIDKRLGQIRNDALYAAVELGRGFR
jgi:hypothetical protein